MSRAFYALLAIGGLVGAAAGALYLYSPPLALDVLDRMFGSSGAVLVAEGLPFTEGLKLDVWAAPAPAGTKRPRGEYGFAARAYASRGFVVVMPDYRKVPSVHFPAFVQDGAAAVAWTEANIARLGGDPRRLVLGGHSAGAYIAAMLALDRQYLAAAGASPGVVRAVAGLAGPYDFYPFRWPRAVAAMGQAPDPLKTQPITFARADAPPMWLATGTADEEVRPSNSRALAARERALGSRTTLLREYQGKTHNDIIMAISQPFRRKAPVLDESVAFFMTHLGEGPAK
jgi:acetyl esterase/lipase